MEYKVIVSPRAQKEIETAVEFYASHSPVATQNFINTLSQRYFNLAINPFLVIRYKNVRTIRMGKFPFSLFYVINEKTRTVKILSCFHNKRNPRKKPRY